MIYKREYRSFTGDAFYQHLFSKYWGRNYGFCLISMLLFLQINLFISAETSCLQQKKNWVKLGEIKAFHPIKEVSVQIKQADSEAALGYRRLQNELSPLPTITSEKRGRELKSCVKVLMKEDSCVAQVDGGVMKETSVNSEEARLNKQRCINVGFVFALNGSMSQPGTVNATD